MEMDSFMRNWFDLIFFLLVALINAWSNIPILLLNQLRSHLRGLDDFIIIIFYMPDPTLYEWYRLSYVNASEIKEFKSRGRERKREKISFGCLYLRKKKAEWKEVQRNERKNRIDQHFEEIISFSTGSNSVLSQRADKISYFFLSLSLSLSFHLR